MLVRRLMTDGQFVRDLFESPPNSQVKRQLEPYPGPHTLGMATALASLFDLIAGLLSSATRLPTAALDLAADGAAVSAQQARNLRGRVIGFHEDVELLSFVSTEVLVLRATSTWRSERT